MKKPYYSKEQLASFYDAKTEVDILLFKRELCRTIINSRIGKFMIKYFT